MPKYLLPGGHSQKQKYEKITKSDKLGGKRNNTSQVQTLNTFVFLMNVNIKILNMMCDACCRCFPTLKYLNFTI